MSDDGVLFKVDTLYDHYQVADKIYGGRPARVLYGGNGYTAQSGIARDGKSELLFDYNERFMELVRGVRPRNLLQIGGGAFTLPTALKKEFPALNLDIVELDGELVNIAKQYFDFRPNRKTHVYIGDGRQFVDTVDQVYDMIIIDVFVQADIPEQFCSPEAALSFKSHLHAKGVLAINIIGSLQGRLSTTLRQLQETLQSAFPDVTIFPASGGLSSWTGQNFVLAAQSGSRDLARFIRHAPVTLP